MYYDPTLICFERRPALFTVHLHMVDPDDLILPWGQLTIRFDNTRLAQACVQTMGKCDRLVDLTLSSSTCNPANYSDIVLPFLLSLALGGSASFCFDAFRAVRLKKAVLGGHCDFDSLQESATKDSTICFTLILDQLFERYTNLSHVSVTNSTGHEPADTVPHILHTLEACLRHILSNLTHLDFPDLYVDSPECVHHPEDIVQARVRRRARDATALKSLASGLCALDHISRLLNTLRSLKWVTHWGVEQAPSDEDEGEKDSGFGQSFDGRSAWCNVEEVLDDGTSGSVNIDVDGNDSDDWAEVEGQLIGPLGDSPAYALASDGHSGATELLGYSDHQSRRSRLPVGREVRAGPAAS